MFNKFITSTATVALLLGAAGAASAQSMIGTTGATFKGSTVTFPNVEAPSDGYLVIHEVRGGQVVAPQSLGYTPVMAGDNANVAVDIGMPFEEGMTYQAMLHAETNGNDTYDFGEGMTDVDTPVVASGAPITQNFIVAKGGVEMTEPTSEYASVPKVDANDPNDNRDNVRQDDTSTRIGEVPMFAESSVAVSGDTATFPRVDAGQPGFLTIHEIANGQPVLNESLGYAALQPGENDNVTVDVDAPFVKGKSYVAMIHNDTNDNDRFDANGGAEVDSPALDNGQPVMLEFTAS
ncbi:DUF7282 domain-containing protein [Oceaniglobus roseus]|uniref:DUF7282 domain-containing protein n=1 Tax=Oceaniglobus roseus TaxID=1737570 RepID=UPI000C7ECF86|nr:hypothetical protein [Kandeliimicrobium roseum]